MASRVFYTGLCAITCACLTFAPFSLRADVADELQKKLNAQKETLKDIDAKIAEFKQKVQEKRATAQTLQGQIEIINDGIENITLSIKKTEAQIDQTDAEVENVQYDIAKKEDSIDKGKIVLADYIRQMQTLDMQSSVAVFLKYSTLSDAITESSTVEQLQEQAHNTIIKIQKEKQELQEKKAQLDDFKQSLDALKTRQRQQQQALFEQNASKQQVLKLTNAQESQYQELLEQSKADAKAAQAAISDLDSKIREQLRARGVGNLGTVGSFSWPIEPIFGISCPFHCGGYPYEYLIGPHSGTDMPTNVGTPIKAPADGYVGRAHDSGGRGYSYIMLIHGEEFSTVFGHVSGFAVEEGKFVKRGDIIGYTGGAAGSRGSGLSTGAHLHFEVRKNNIAVNAERYLEAR
ncbi:MAG TPA: peptidoglycan DD-metalloendopeptidase family protein [Candidatus Andersenbacteria bacterium]|nr:peptidoglycan DD-metalloendopeptidase family protein [Candidatus Andersenbacteria bacterium]